MRFLNYDNFDNNETFDCYKNEDKGSEMSLNECGYEKCSPKHIWHGVRGFYLFHYVISGKGVLVINGAPAREVCAGQCFFIQPDDEIYYEADSKDPWEYIWIGFGGLSAKSHMKDCSLCSSPVQDVKNKEKLLSIYKDMVSNSRKGEFANLLMLSVLYRFVVYLLESYKVDDRDRALSVKEQNFRKILKIIDARYKENLNIEKLSQSVGYEKTYVYRLFKEFLDMPPKQYIMYLRLYDAMQQIKNMDGERFMEISAKVGFSEYPNFYKAFKRFINMSPEEYRRRVRSGEVQSYQLKQVSDLEEKIERFRR